MTTLTIDVINPLTDPRWSSAIAGQPAGLFLTSDWMQVQAEVYGFDFSAVVVGDSERILSAVPYSVIDDARGARVRSLPFSDVVAFPVSDPAHWPKLAEHLTGLGASVQLAVPEGHVAFDPAWEVTQPFVWQQLASAVEADEHISRCSASTRTAIRRSARSGFSIRSRTDSAAIDEFFDLHLGLRKHRHHILAQPRQMFHSLGDQFFGDGRGAIVSVERDGEMTAGAVVLAHESTVYYKFGASAPEHRNEGVNHAMIHGIALWAGERGYAIVDLGRSDLGADGLWSFKSRLGGVSQPLMRAVYPSPSPATAAESEFSATLGRLTDLFIAPGVPDEVTEAAGAELYHYFS